jgi:hypothetical protein
MHAHHEDDGKRSPREDGAKRAMSESVTGDGVVRHTGLLIYTFRSSGLHLHYSPHEMRRELEKIIKNRTLPAFIEPPTVGV